MNRAFLLGLLDELEKQAGIGTRIKGFLSKAKAGAKEYHGARTEQAKETWEKRIPEARREAGAFLKGRKGKAAKVGRRALHEVRKHMHTRKVDPKTLDPKARALAGKAGVRIEEAGPQQHPTIRKIRKYTASRYEPPELGAARAHAELKPHKGRVVIGGRAKDAPEVTKHELGHASGAGKKHGFKAALVTRSAGPTVAKGLAALGKGRAAKAVQAASDVGTMVEEGRAWKRSGVGSEALRKAKKGDIAGAAKKIKDPAIGLGSYAAAARKSQKTLGERAAKALAKRKA